MSDTNLISLIGLQEQIDKIDSQIFELSEKYDWKPLDLVIRGWIAMSGFEKDQQKYTELADLYNFKSV